MNGTVLFLLFWKNGIVLRFSGNEENVTIDCNESEEVVFLGNQNYLELGFGKIKNSLTP